MTHEGIVPVDPENSVGGDVATVGKSESTSSPVEGTATMMVVVAGVRIRTILYTRSERIITDHRRPVDHIRTTDGTSPDEEILKHFLQDGVNVTDCVDP